MSACVIATSPASTDGHDAAPTPTAPVESPQTSPDPAIDPTPEAAADPRPIDDVAEEPSAEGDPDPPASVDNPIEVPVDAIADDPLPDDSESPEPPARLRIDSLGVDADIEFVGVTDEGDMDVPSEWDNVAWYEPGTVPGDRGNAVVAGHYDSDTGPAVFFDLKQLATGDLVHIVTESGEELVFEVIEIESVHVNDADTRKIFGRTDERNLNLITCEGVWDPAAGMYDQRLIVYTTLVNS